MVTVALHSCSAAKWRQDSDAKTQFALVPWPEEHWFSTDPNDAGGHGYEALQLTFSDDRSELDRVSVFKSKAASRKD
jgi:hypothetical protein